MTVVATNNLAEVPQHYTLALDGTIQRLTLAKDISGNTLDATNILNIFVDQVHLQLSNDAVAATDKCFIGYKSGAAPTTLDKTVSMLDLVPSNTLVEIPRSNAAKQRGLQSFLLAQIAAGKISETQVKETLDALVEAQKQVLIATEKLTNALIKAEYPFQPALTAIPKPK